MAFLLISVLFASNSGNMSGIGIHTLNGHCINGARAVIFEDARILEIHLHIGFCQIMRWIYLGNDYVDLPVANILHPSGHVVPTPLLTIMEDQSIVETVKSEILIIARTPHLTPWLEHGG